MKVALARPTDRGEPFSSWSLTKLRAHLLCARVVPTISRSQLWQWRVHGVKLDDGRPMTAELYATVRDAELALAFATGRLYDGVLDDSAAYITAAEQAAPTVPQERREPFAVRLASARLWRMAYCVW